METLLAWRAQQQTVPFLETFFFLEIFVVLDGAVEAWRGAAHAQGAPRTWWFPHSPTKPILFHPTGVSAALVFQQEVQAPSTPLRVAFDGDAVLFSDETDQVFREQGLEGAMQYERAMEAVPMGEVSEAAAGPTPTISFTPARALLWVAKNAQIFMGSLCI